MYNEIIIKEQHSTSKVNVMTNKTRTQLRGICPVCLKQHATKGGNMVSHGYTVGFGFQNNVCDGADAPHLGHKDAPAFIANYMGSIERSIEETAKKLEDSSLTLRMKGRLNNQVEMLKRFKEILAERKANWKEADLVVVDLDVEAQEEKSLKELRKKEREDARAAKKAENEKKRIEREAKSKEKWDGILAENRHIIEHKGDVIADWVGSYGSRKEMEDAHYETVRNHLDDIGADNMGRMHFVNNVIHRVKVNGNKGKQLHKF